MDTGHELPISTTSSPPPELQRSNIFFSGRHQKGGGGPPLASGEARRHGEAGPDQRVPHRLHARGAGAGAPRLPPRRLPLPPRLPAAGQALRRRRGPPRQGRAHHRRLLRHRRAPGVRVREERRVRGAGGPDGDRAARRGQDGAGAGRAGRAGGAGGHHRRGGGQAGRRGDRRPLRQTESPGGQRRRVVQLLLRGDHQHIRLPKRHGSQLLGRGVPDLLRAALPEGQPRQHRGHRLRRRQGPRGADELLQREQRRGDPLLRDAAGGAGAARPRHHPRARLRRLQPHHGQGRPEGRQRRLRRGGPRHKRGAAAGGEDGDAGGGGGGERAVGRPLRDVARVVLAIPHGDVRRAGARRLVLQGLLRLQVQRQGRRRAQQEDPHGRRRQEVPLPQEHPLPVPISRSIIMTQH